MIYIKVELWPCGDKSRARTLGEARIANVGGTSTQGKYLAQLSKVGGFKADALAAPKLPNTLRTVAIDGFPRKRLYAWDLLLRVLASAFATRNPGTSAVAFDHEVLGGLEGELHTLGETSEVGK